MVRSEGINNLPSAANDRNEERASKLQGDERLRRMIAEMNAYLIAWHGYSRGVWRAGGSDFRRLDQFVRRRVR